MFVLRQEASRCFSTSCHCTQSLKLPGSTLQTFPAACLHLLLNTFQQAPPTNHIQLACSRFTSDSYRPASQNTAWGRTLGRDLPHDDLGEMLLIIQSVTFFNILTHLVYKSVEYICPNSKIFTQKQADTWDPVLWNITLTKQLQYRSEKNIYHSLPHTTYSLFDDSLIIPLKPL